MSKVVALPLSFRTTCTLPPSLCSTRVAPQSVRCGTKRCETREVARFRARAPKKLEKENFAFLNVSAIKKLNETLFLAFERLFLEEPIRPCE